MTHNYYKISVALFLFILTLSLIIFPSEALEASKRGLDMWWTIVFPSLLPFFILSELLISIGIVHFIGVWLEPLMRPLFRIPGVGGFVWVMGMASGFPSGAKYTVRLREEGKLSREEANRLLAFTNCSNPLFIFGAISVGFFVKPELGILLAATHYGSNILVGICMRFYHFNERKPVQQKRTSSLLSTSFSVLMEKLHEEKRPFGRILGDAVSSSVQTLLMIGGFIISFSVCNELLSTLGITNMIGHLLIPILHMLQLPISIDQPIIGGLLEITLGSKLTSELDNVSLFTQVILISGLLAFSGFSVQAQVASIISGSDLSFKMFFIGRLLQSFFAILLAIILYNPLYASRLTESSTVFAPFIEKTSHVQSLLYTLGPPITILFLSLYTFYFYIQHYHKKAS